MIRITLNGSPFDPQTLDDILIQSLVEQVREKLGSIRHPETGEFPTVSVTGSSLDGLQVQIEGSPELVQLVQERLAEEEGASESTGGEPSSEDVPTARAPNVFLSYAFDDSPLAQAIAEQLQANGIETFWAEWCIYPGDSIRQRIDEGIGECTHFIVLLTPQSIDKPWVNLEVDAGLARRLGKGCRFIPLRCGLKVGDLPPTLQTMLSPEIDPNTLDIAQLINDIHGITRKPPLGAAPAVLSSTPATKTGYSAAATALAKLFVDSTKCAQKFDPQFTIDALVASLGMTEEDVDDAIHELSGLVTKHSETLIYPEEELFVRFDKFWMGWDPAEDALRIATGIVGDDAFPSQPGEAAKRLGWEPRRMNPALAFLAKRGLLSDIHCLDGGPWVLSHLMKTDGTRRFVKSRQS